MNITDVRIRKINDESKMKAVVSITFDDEFVQKQGTRSEMPYSQNTTKF